MSLRPFFKFYGGKWRDSPNYPKPVHNTIIEPFAGSAGYSVRYFNKNIILYDKDPFIIGIWKYLISVSESDILNLPDVHINESVDELNVSQEARWLIGFWINSGVTRPMKTPSKWMRSNVAPGSFWGIKARERIANQISYIRHWKAILGSFDTIPNKEATWFIDPPYEKAGRHYTHSSKNINYNDLSKWCRERLGQVIVCEQNGATWLPFRYHGQKKTTIKGRKSNEVVWTNKGCLNV